MNRVTALILCMAMLCGSALAATSYAKLKRGDSGVDVTAMQSALKSLGFSVEPDGKYGYATERIVREFQKKYQLDADGVAGNQTLTLLYQLAPAFQPTTGGAVVVFPTATGTPIPVSSASSRLERGSEGAAVVEMQSMLAKLGYSISADGKFGYATYLVVKSFQKNNGLTADGIAGAQTLAMLRTLTAGAATPTPTPTPTVAPQTNRTKLQQGDEGADVLALQQMLAKAGYSLTPDGKYGDTTYRIVRSFQKTYGLTVDGIAGAQTIALLKTLTSATPTPTPSPSPTPTPTAGMSDTRLERGSEGAAVVEMQSMLAKLGYSISADGKFGYATYLIVKSFQKNNGLTADGIAGYQTLALLRSLTGAAATASPTPTPTPTPIIPATPASAVVTTTGGILYFRETPSKSGAVLAKIPNRATVDVIERGSIWTTVRYNGVIGYVMTAFLTFVTGGAATETPTPTPTPAPSSAPAVRAARVTGGKLYLRAQPSRSSAALAVIPDGAYLSVLSESATWSAVSYENVSGYVMTKYIVFIAPTASPTPVSSPSASPSPSASASPTPGYDTALLTRTLSSGMTGSDVTAVQTRLAALNYLASSAVSGAYDTATVASVRTFQRVHGLGVDGIAGKQTFTILFSDDASPYSSQSESYSTLHIYYQSADPDLVDDIERMQARLAALGYTANVTGKFDETTYMAVLAFQLRNGLTVDGVGSIAMQNKLFSSSAKSSSASPSYTLEEGAGVIAGPSASSVKLLHWFNDIKPTLSSGDHLLVFDPASGRSWTLRLYAAGNHADSEPLTLRDTMIMNAAFGKPSWTTHPVYVQLPGGQWTVASMHNHPHLTGSIKANGFDGHLCVHFLRDMSECQSHDPNYGVSNQKTIRSLWQRLTGETIDY